MKLHLWQLSAVHHARNPESCDCGGNVHYEAELYEQTMTHYLWGRFAWWLNNTCTKIAPRFFDPGRGGDVLHEDGSVSFGWRLRFELWGVYDAEHAGRKVIERVRVQNRDPDRWHLDTDAFAPEA
jgi:hypothetical protein